MQTMWIWCAIGLILLAAEMATGTFYVLWFGVAALIMALISWLMPELNISLQLVLFAVLSVGSLFIWRTYYKKNETHSRIGQSKGEEIGRVGTVIEAISASQNGRIQFAQGLMGSREWTAIANENIAVGTQAVIVSVEGNALRVKRQ
jgi:membrane protein implicated in regulation of membrane protease activity